MSVPLVKLSQMLASDFLIGHSIASLAEATQNGGEEGRLVNSESWYLCFV